MSISKTLCPLSRARKTLHDLALTPPLPLPPSHCNSGSRVDANEVVGMLVPQGIAVFALDFAGSGNSDGEHVTLGVDEVDDVEVVVAWLREKKKASHIGMWGRSMGAVVCLLYGKRDPTIAGIVLDSPFASLVSLMEELAASHKLLTGFLTKPLISILRRSIRKRANFDILKANPLKAVSSSFIPALFGHGKEDDFVAFKHSERLYEAYAGDKNLISFDGGHNSPRPDFFHTSVLIFFMNVLGPLSAGSPSPVRRTGSPNTIPDEVLLQEALALSLT